MKNAFLLSVVAVVVFSAVSVLQGQVSDENGKVRYEDVPNTGTGAVVVPIPGGYHITWGGKLADVGGVKVPDGMVGNFEVLFDVAYPKPARDKDGNIVKGQDGAPVMQDLPRRDDLVKLINKKDELPQDPDELQTLLLSLADYWVFRGKPEHAVPLYKKGLEQNPNDFMLQNNLALLLSSEGGDNTEALQVIDKALSEKRDNPNLIDTKGLILMKDGKPDSAIPNLERAVELSCQHPMYCLHLAKALDQAGRQGEAKNWFGKIRPLLEAIPTKMVGPNKAMYDDLRMKY